MITPDEGDNRKTGVMLNMVAVVIGAARKDADVAAVVTQLPENSLGVAQRHGEINAGIAGIEDLDHLDDMGRTDRADSQLAAPQIGTVLQHHGGIIFQPDHLPGDMQKFMPDLRQFDAASTALEQENAMLFFKRLDLGGYRRLAHFERTRRGGETVVVGNSNEAAQLA